MTKERSEEQLAAGRVAQRLLVDQMGRASLPLIVLFVVGIVVGFQEGFTTRGAAFLYGGAIVSVLTTLFYSLPTILTILGDPKRAWMALAAFGGFVPYVWSLYVIFIPGLWFLIADFSLGQLVLSGFLVLLGYWHLRAFWKLTELVKQLERSQVLRTYSE